MTSVADDKTFCIDIADIEVAISQPGRLSGFAATKATEVRGVIDPATSIA